MKTRHNILVYILLSMAFMCGCEETRTNFINPDLVKIYLFNTDNQYNAYVLDVKQTEDNGLLFFGIGSNSPSKFDGNGTIFLQKIDGKGDVVWTKFYNEPERGFPVSEIFENEGKYYVIWNQSLEHFYAYEFSGDITQPLAISEHQIDLTLNFTPTYLTAAAIAKDGSAFIVQGLGTFVNNGNKYKKIFVSELGFDFKTKANLTEQEFEPTAFGLSASSNYAVVKKMDKYFNIEYSDKYFFTAPLFNKMAIKFIGDAEPIYIDPTYWAGTIVNTSDGKLAMIVSNPDLQAITPMLVLNVDPNPVANSFQMLYENSNVSPLIDLDISSKTEIIYLPSGDLIVVGTSNSGQIVINRFSSTGELLARKTMGQNYRMEVAKALLLLNGSALAIIGSTKVEHKYQRAFAIKIFLEDI